MIQQRAQCFKDIELGKRIKIRTLRILKCFHLLFHRDIVEKVNFSIIMFIQL